MMKFRNRMWINKIYERDLHLRKWYRRKWKYSIIKSRIRFQWTLNYIYSIIFDIEIYESYLYPSTFHEFSNFLNSIHTSLISFPFYPISRHHGEKIIIMIIIMIHFTNFQIFPIRSILLWFRFPFYTISRHGEEIIIIIIIIMIDRTKEISFPFLNIEIYQSYLYPTIFHKFSNFPNSKFRSFSLFPLLSNIEKRNNNNNNDKNDWPNERNFLSAFKYRNLWIISLSFYIS